MCFNFLGTSHQISQCDSRGCNICNNRHHTLLHFTPTINNRTHFPYQFSAQTRNNNFQRNAHSSSVNSGPISSGNLFLWGSSHPQRQQSQIFTPHNDVRGTQNSSLVTSTLNSATVQQNTPLSQCLSVLSMKSFHVLFGMAQIFMYSSQGIRIPAKAILDPCSQSSFITS